MNRILIVFALILAGCHTRTVLAPSTAVSQASVNRAHQNVTDASRTNSQAIESNARARTKAERIEAKAMVIDRFWK